KPVVDTINEMEADAMKSRLFEGLGDQASILLVDARHQLCQVDNRLGGYKLVRSVGRFRKDQSGGGIVGITYELVEKLRVVGFEDNTIPR
ncbi:hypothetical protein ACC754_37185, partial [Rhizobium johnstonii]